MFSGFGSRTFFRTSITHKITIPDLLRKCKGDILPPFCLLNKSNIFSLSFLFPHKLVTQKGSLIGQKCSYHNKRLFVAIFLSNLALIENLLVTRVYVYKNSFREATFSFFLTDVEVLPGGAFQPPPAIAREKWVCGENRFDEGATTSTSTSTGFMRNFLRERKRSISTGGYQNQHEAYGGLAAGA
jgi:hypothetical protein